MPLSFPLSLAEFFDHGDMIVQFGGFHLGEAMEFAETGNGEVLTSARGERLWEGTIRTPTIKARRQARLRAVLNALRQPGATFLVTDTEMRFPAADPQGAILAAASPVVAQVYPDRSQLSIGGLPAQYKVTAGDHISVAFGVGGARRAYFEVVQGATVAGGVAGPLTVSPWVPIAVQAGNAAQLLNPALKAKYRPGSYSGSDRQPGRVATGLSFSWLQTLG